MYCLHSPCLHLYMYTNNVMHIDMFKFVFTSPVVFMFVLKHFWGQYWRLFLYLYL